MSDHPQDRGGINHLGRHDYFADFYLLHFAKQDLKFSDDQWYWPSATKENIDQEVTERLQSWLTEHPVGA